LVGTSGGRLHGVIPVIKNGEFLWLGL
jgi:hypothetical protein